MSTIDHFAHKWYQHKNDKIYSEKLAIYVKKINYPTEVFRLLILCREKCKIFSLETCILGQSCVKIDV